MSAVPSAPRKGKRSHAASFVESEDVAESHYPADDQNVYFVRERSTSSSDQKYHKKTFEMLTEAGVDPQWMSEEDCLQLDGRMHFFVVISFRGPVFEHLEKKKAKVLSTAVVRQCLSEGRALPKWDHPIASLNLAGTKICFSGLPFARREQLSKLVWWMNGEVTRNLIPGVTHLVLEKCNTVANKYRAARSLKIPVMQPEWIEAAWKLAENHEYSIFSSEEVRSEYALPLFKNMIICTSGVQGQERVDLLRLIELHGGQSKGEMRRNECTHLITDSVVGTKYRKAVEWTTVRIVTVRWVRKSIEAGYVQDEKRFDPATPLPAKTSTQNAEGAAPPDLDYSSIYAPLKNHTLNSQMIVVEGGQKKGTAEKAFSTPTTMPRVNSKRRLSPGEEAASGVALNKLLNNTLRGDLDFFEGVSVFICGMDRARQEKINRLLDKCGATRVAEMEQATHIVVISVGDMRNTLLDVQKNGQADVVRADWLSDCVEKKELLSTEEYIWDPEVTLVRTASTTSVVNDSQVSNCAIRASTSGISNGTTTTSGAMNMVTEMEGMNADGLASVPESTVFANRSFRLHSLESDKALLLEEAIKKAGGTILCESDDDLADYMVTNPVELGAAPLPSDFKFMHLVTEVFVRVCIARRKELGPKERPLFRPIPAVAGSKVFERIVIGFMAVEAAEKLVLKELVGRFAGKVEATIVSRERDGMKPCTHLVVGEKSSRLADCKKKLPRLKIVDASWVIECIINDKILVETRFPFTGVAYENYERSDDLWVDRPMNREQQEEIVEEGNNTVYMEEDLVLPLETPRQTPLEESVLQPPDFRRCATSTPINGRSASRPTPRRINSDTMHFNPRMNIDVSHIVQEIPSPAGTSDSSFGSFNVSKIGRMLSEAAIRTGKEPVPQPQKSATEPSSMKRPTRSSFRPVNTMGTPKRAPAQQPSMSVVKEEVKPFASGSQTNELMMVQMEAVKELRRKAEEEERERAAQSMVVSTTQKSRKRPHELLEDSPMPPRKRSPVEEAPVIGWSTDMNAGEGGGSVEVIEEYVQPVESASRTGSDGDTDGRAIGGARIGGTIDIESEPSRGENENTDDLLSVPGTSILRRSSRVSGGSRSNSHEKSKSASRQTTASAQSVVVEEPPPPPPQKVFLFTGVSSEDKPTLTEAIIQLGGRAILTDKQEVPDDVTHLICRKLVRGTKLMGCIASGRWVMVPEYVTESLAAGCWLPEEDYEWGSPTVIQEKGLDGRELQIAKASRRWRLAGNTLVFDGWRTLLYAPKEKAHGVIPLLRAGGAQVFLRDATTTIAQARPTHVVVIKSVFWTKEELEKLMATGAKVFSLDYISHAVLEENVREQDWFHNDYRLEVQRAGRN